MKLPRGITLVPTRLGVDWELAMKMWGQGLDTLDIARFFRVHESVIYNILPRSKKQRAAE